MDRPDRWEQQDWEGPGKEVKEGAGSSGCGAGRFKVLFNFIFVGWGWGEGEREFILLRLVLNS